jgi:hypothetical protein
VHGRELPRGGRRQVDVERLALADVGAAVGRQVDHALLLDLPHRLVQLLPSRIIVSQAQRTVITLTPQPYLSQDVAGPSVVAPLSAT